MNATVDKVITGRMRIAEVRALSPQEAAANERMQRDEAAGVTKPRKPRGPSKKMRALLEMARNEGYELAMQRDRGTEMIGGAIGWGLALVSGVALGAWLF